MSLGLDLKLIATRNVLSIKKVVILAMGKGELRKIIKRIKFI